MSLDLATSLTELRDVQITKYAAAGCTALLAYDYLITFEMEKKYVWDNTWKLGKILYILTRYSPMIDAPLLMTFRFLPGATPGFCHNLLISETWFLFFSILIAEVVLVFRTSAIWGGGRRVTIILGTLLGLVAVLAIVVVEIYLKSSQSPPNPASGGCLVTGGSSIVFLGFLAATLFECLIFIMTATKAYKSARHTTSVLTATLYRDGMAFFVYLCSISIVNIVILATVKNQDLSLILTFPLGYLHSILSSRILLHMWQAVANRTDQPISISNSTLRFAPNPKSHRTTETQTSDSEAFELRTRPTGSSLSY